MARTISRAMMGSFNKTIGFAGLVCAFLMEACTANVPVVEPQKITFESLNLVSYDAKLAQIKIKGTVAFADATDLTDVSIHLDSTCSDSSLGHGTKADFEKEGIQINVDSRDYSVLFAKTNIHDDCIYIYKFEPQFVAPAVPVFVSSVPASPSRVSSTPTVFGILDSTADSVRFFDDPQCAHLVGVANASDFKDFGAVLTLSPGVKSQIYSIAKEPFGLASACSPFTIYDHDTSAPAVPVFVQSVPVSPNNVSATPLVSGTVDEGTDHVDIFKDSACTLKLATGTGSDFLAGIQLTLSLNSTTPIYAQSVDGVGNRSACAFLLAYSHDTIAPGPPSYSTIAPASPTRLSVFPKVRGTASSDTAKVVFFSDSRCLTQIGLGLKSDFEGAAGITISAISNAVVTIYAEDFDAAGNASPCTYLTSFENDTIPPDPPVFTATNPISPNNISTTPLVIGGAPFDATSVSIFDDPSCSNLLNTGSKAAFEGAGILVSAPMNATTSLYAVAYDAVGNASSCTFLSNYAVSNVVPPGPTFLVSTPVSPSRFSTTPWIGGTVVSTISTVRLYSESTCTTAPIGSGSRFVYQSSGILTTVAGNAATNIYGAATDVYGNTSLCTFLTQYKHSNVQPFAPSFISYTPASPNRISVAPAVVGLAADNPGSILPTTNVSIYDSALCGNRIGTGSKALFTSSGIVASVPANAVTTVYAKAFDDAGNASVCASMGSYTMDSVLPQKPVFVAASPATPSYTRTTQLVASIAAKTKILPISAVNIYTDSACTAMIGSGTATQITSTGIQVVAPRNAITPFYGQSRDSVGNLSACQFLVNYQHNDLGPAGPTATLNPDLTVTLTWTLDPIASPTPTYTLKRATRSGGPYTTLSTGISGNSFNDANVSLGKTYYYVVLASNNTGTSLNSSEVSVTVSGTPPPPSTALVAVPGVSSINLSWIGGSGAASFQLLRATQSGGPYTKIVSQTQQSYVDQTVTSGTAYYYIVRSLNPSGTSVDSTEVSALALGFPQAPTQLHATSVPTACSGGPGVQLTWAPPPYWTSFVINRGTAPGVSSGLANSGTTSYVDCSLRTLNVPYYYTVSTTWNSSTGAASNEVAFQYTPAPTLTAYPGNNEVVLNWTNNNGATQFEVYRSLKSGRSFTLLSTLAGTTFTDSTVVNGTGYYYIVKPYWSGALGFSTNEVSAVPGSLPSAPSNVVMVVSGNLPTLYWSAPSKYNYFNVYRAPAAGGPYTLLSASNVTTFTDLSPTNGLNYYKVTTVWGNNESAFSNAVWLRYAIPVGLTATPGTGKITLNWTSFAGASSYIVRRSTTSGGPYSQIANPATNTYVDSTTTNGVGYYYVVAPKFVDATIGQNSIEVSGTVASSVPSGLTLLGSTGTSLTLGWAKIANATAYKLYSSTTSGGTYTFVSTGSPNSATVTGLIANTTTYYKVSAVVGGVESNKSTALQTYTASAPGTPVGIPGDTNLSLSWGPSVGATSYAVKRSTDGASFSTIATGITSPTFTDTGLSNGVQYFYQIVGVFSGVSLTSGMSGGITPGIVPVAPSGISIIQNSTGTDLSLSWAPSLGSSSYNIYSSQVSGGPYSFVTNSGSNIGNAVSALTTGSTYYFVVTALNGTVESGYSPEVASIPQVTPTAPAVSVDSLGRVVLNWSSVAGATKYNIERSIDAAEFSSIATGVATTSYTDSSVVGGQGYYYRYWPLDASNVELSPSAVSIEVTPGTAPLAPANLIAKPLDATSVQLNWVLSPVTVDHLVYRATASGGPYTLISPVVVPTSTFVDTTVSAGQSYYYVVRGRNSSGVESTSSNEASVSVSAAPANLAATSSTNLIHLSWNALGGVSSYTLRRSTVSGGPYQIISTGSLGTSYDDTNLLNGVTYFYVVGATYSGGGLSLDSGEVGAIATVGVNLRVPIELLDQGLASLTTSQTFERTQTSLDPSYYDGTVTYSFECVVTNSDNVPRNVDLIDSSGAVVASLTVPSLTSTPTRISVAAVPNGTWDYYRVRMAGSTVSAQVQVQSARIWVNQVAASRTRIYVPLSSATTGSSPLDLATPLETTFRTSYSALDTSSLFKRDTSRLDRLLDYNAWELETVVATTGSAGGWVALQNKTRGQIVSATEAYFQSPGITMINSEFDEGTNRFDITNEGDEYHVALACSDNCGTGSEAAIYRAGLWINLDHLYKTDVFVRVARGDTPVTGLTDFENERTLLSLAAYSNPTIYFQAVAVGPLSGGVDFGLADVGVGATGIGSLNVVAGSTLTFSSQVKARFQSSDLSVTGNHHYIVEGNLSTGTADLIDGTMVVHVNR